MPLLGWTRGAWKGTSGWDGTEPYILPGSKHDVCGLPSDQVETGIHFDKVVRTRRPSVHLLALGRTVHRRSNRFDGRATWDAWKVATFPGARMAWLGCVRGDVHGLSD